MPTHLEKQESIRATITFWEGGGGRGIIGDRIFSCSSPPPSLALPSPVARSNGDCTPRSEIEGGEGQREEGEGEGKRLFSRRFRIADHALCSIGCKGEGFFSFTLIRRKEEVKI